MEFKRLNTPREIRELIQFHNENSPYVVIDTETTSVNPRQAKLLDIQISGREQDDVVIFSGSHAQALLEFAPHILLVAHNYKYDAHVLFRHNVDLLDRDWRDTLLIGHLLDENRDSYSLDSYVKEYYNDDYKEKFWTKYKTYEEASEEDKTQYACKDIIYTRKLYSNQCEQAHKEGIPLDLILHVHRLQASLLRTEITGIRVDIPYLQDLGVKIKRRIDELLPEIGALVKDEIDLVELELWQKGIEKYKSDAGKAKAKRPTFNINSTQQLQSLLYDKLGLPIQRKKKSVTTDAGALEKLKDAHPVVPLIIDYRQYPIVYNTFICGTLEKQDSGRVYPQFVVNGTVGSRISHRDPNMGNIPASGGVKGIFIPDDGELFGEFDYSQLEVCIEAHLTQDKNLLEIVLNNASKHDITAANLKIERPLAKTLNFAMQYWCTYFKVASLLKCSEKEGLYIWNKYWETYSGAMALKKETDKLIDDGIPLTDWFGRKRRFAVVKRSPWDGDYRSGYNFRVQSPGGQLMNNSFYKSDAKLRKVKIGKGILTVHDSGLMGIKKDFLEEGAKIVEEFMVNEGVLAKLTVPLKISAKTGMSRWEDK